MNDLEKKLTFDLFKNIDQPPTFRPSQEEKKQEVKEKNTFFLSFLKLMKNCISYIPTVKTVIILESKEKKEIEKSALEFLEKNDFISFNKLIHSGYQIPPEQLKLYTKKLLDFIDNDYDSHKIVLNDLVKDYHIFLPKEIIHAIFFNCTFQIYHHNSLNAYEKLLKYQKLSIKETSIIEEMKKDNKFSHLCPEVANYLSNYSNKMELFIDLLKLIKEYSKSYINIKHSILTPYNFFEEHIIPSLNKDDIQKIGQILQEFKLTLLKENKTSEVKLLEPKIQNLDLTEKELNSEDLNELIEKTKRIYLNEAVNQKIEQKQKKYYSDIPQEANNIITEIYNVHKKLKNNKDNLIVLNEKHKINKLINERVPEILEKYISIDNEYKQSLTNTEGKTPFDLMIASLENILDYFKEINLSLNEEKITELSVKEKYTQQFKKI